MTYRFKSSYSVGEEVAGVRVDEVGNFEVKTRGDAKPFAAFLRIIAGEIETDAATKEVAR